MPTVIGLPGTKGAVSVAPSKLGPGGRVSWHPERLRANLISAVVPAAKDWGRLAAAAAPSGRVAASLFVRGAGPRASVGFSHPIANILIHGAKPHIIGDVGQKLRMKGSGDVVSGPVVHPGIKPNPFLKAILPAWTSVYRRRASAATRVA